MGLGAVRHAFSQRYNAQFQPANTVGERNAHPIFADRSQSLMLLLLNIMAVTDGLEMLSSSCSFGAERG